MAKSRKNVIGKRNRRNKTIRGGDDTVKPSPVSDDTDLPPPLPRLFDVVKHKDPSPVKLSAKEIKALNEDQEFLKTVLQFTHTSDQQFQRFIENPKHRNKVDIFRFLKERLLAYLTGKRYIREQVNILKGYINSDDFDSVMQTRIREDDEDFFRIQLY